MSKDHRKARNDILERMRDQAEKNTGHTPTDQEQRGLERKADDVAVAHSHKYEK